MVREICEECEVVEFEICFTKGLSYEYEAAFFICGPSSWRGFAKRVVLFQCFWRKFRGRKNKNSQLFLKMQSCSFRLLNFGPSADEGR